MHDRRIQRLEYIGRLPKLAACALAAAIGLQAGSGLAVESRGTKPVTIAAPVRLPKVQTTEQAAAIGAKLQSQLQPLVPFRFTPMTGVELHAFEPLPTVDFDLGLPPRESPTIGGWISVGYSRGALGL